MSNPNPFLPKGSLLEQQSQSRSRLKLAVFCVVAVGTLGLVAMLIQGCKRDTGTDNGTLPMVDTNPVVTNDMNAVNPPMPEYPTNVPPSMASNPVVNPLPPTLPTTTATPTAAPTDVPTVGGAEYIVVAGDTLGKIATKNHVTLKALEAANPGVDSKHLKIKQKLVIPAGGSSAVATPTVSENGVPETAATSSTTTYVVKSGDNLHKLSTKFGVSVKAIQAANHLTTTSIKVGQKLKIPGKTAKASKTPKTAAPTVEETAPAVPADTAAPVLPPMTSTSAPAVPVGH
ncbi:MAG TPA: LysM peptidoglycan-binding domain-containing protein [Verrucomicrobiae bacterium]|jgi:LysM repeat protein